MKTTLLGQASEKQHSKDNEKIENKQYSALWKADVEKALQEEREANEKVN